MMLSSCVFLPAVGKQTQLFHIIFIEPGKVILEVPCIYINIPIIIHDLFNYLLTWQMEAGS